MLRLIVACCAALLLCSSCKKDETKKTEPGSKAAQEGAKAVTPAEKKEGKAETKTNAPDEKGNLRVENLKVEAIPSGSNDGKATPKEKRITGPVAIVNGNEIPSKTYYDEVDKILRRSSKIPPERMNRIKENILKRIIEKELIGQSVKKGEVIVPNEEIDKEFADYKKRFRTEEQFQNYLKHGRVTIDSIRKRIREKKELERLLEKNGALTVTDEESKEFYKKNERFYQEREGIRARHILVKLSEKASKEDKTKANAKVKEVQEALKKGMAFEEAAKKYSEGPSAPKGGDLGFFGHGQMVKPFEEIAFAMKPNEVSKPVRTRFGLHVIKVLEKREARKKPYDEVKDTIKESLRNKKFFQERRSLLNNLKKEAKIERKIDIPKATPSKGAGMNPHGGINPHARNPHGTPPGTQPVKPATAKPQTAKPVTAKPATPSK